MRNCIITYKANSWMKKITRQLREEGINVDLIRYRGGRKKVFVGTQKSYYDNIIRFGSTSNSPRLPLGRNVYNKPGNLRDSSNKRVARLKMQEAGVKVPYTFTPRDVILKGLENIDLNYPVVGRNDRHHGGKNVSIFHTPEELASSGMNLGYYSEYYPKTREFRVHVASGKAIIVAEKIVENSEAGYIWNLGDRGVCDSFNTLRWSEYKEPLVESIIKEACKAVESLGLDYGAVDVVSSPSERQEELPDCAILEINSAPRLEEYGISRYVQYFKWLFLHEDKVEFIDSDELDRFSFTNTDYEEEYNRLGRV